MHQVLDTGIKNAKNVLRYTYGVGSLESLSSILNDRRKTHDSYAIYFVDKYFSDQQNLNKVCPIFPVDFLCFVDATSEPTTDSVNKLTNELVRNERDNPCAVIGIGGGTTMDVAKAVSNLLTNGGKAEDYQGWDLVKVPGVFKVGIPTISGTGAEATRTCVMTNAENGLKLGMNSEHTVFDQLILDPLLTATVPREQYFFSGMDAWIHSIEAQNGNYRNPVGDAFSRQAIILCREVFTSGEMMSEVNRAKLMVASYIGGCAIATSYVGVVHPFSAGLSVVLGTHHCVANCITMRGMEEFYPKEFEEFISMIERQKTDLPQGLCNNLDQNQYESLYQATIVHEKPLTNALGSDFRNILTKEKVKELFLHM